MVSASSHVLLYSSTRIWCSVNRRGTLHAWGQVLRDEILEIRNSTGGHHPRSSDCFSSRLSLPSFVLTVLVYGHQHPGLFDHCCGDHVGHTFLKNHNRVVPSEWFRSICRQFLTHKKKRCYLLKEVTIYLSSNPQASNSFSEGYFRRHYVNLGDYEYLAV